MIKKYIKSFGPLFRDKDDFLFIALPLLCLLAIGTFGIGSAIAFLGKFAGIF